MDTKNAKDSSVENFETLFYNNLLPNGSPEITEEFIFRVVKIMINYIKKANDRNEKVTNFHHPKDLEKLLDLNIGNESQSLEETLKDCEMVLENVVKTAHPRFFNQFYQGLDIISLVGDWLTSVTNTNIHTYETGPVYILLENYVLKKIRETIGWQEPGDGIFSPGGSITNLYAVQIALYHYFPQSKLNGFFNLPKPIIFTSKHSHYSMKKAASILGIGLNQVRSVDVDEKGKIIPDELEKMILKCLHQNEFPFLVCLTSGTTVLGAFDPITPVSQICKKYRLWLHIDAAWGGGVLFSKKYKHLMDGVNEADSVCWNPHKIMGSLLQTSAFLVKRPHILSECNAMNATYLFQKDKFYDTNYDIGDKTIQCGRHVDVLKFWLMWKSKGTDGFEMHINKLYDLANYFCEQLKLRSNFELVQNDPECTNVCFWYVPDSLKPLKTNSFLFKQKLHQVAPKIKEKMICEGSMMISYQPLDDKPNFFRIVFSNPATENKDLDFVLNEFEKLGKSLEII